VLRFLLPADNRRRNATVCDNRGAYEPKEVDSMQSKEFRCRQCGQVFQNEQALKDHEIECQRRSQGQPRVRRRAAIQP
jgi:hypothetical protein